MSVKLQIEVSEELLEQLRQKFHAPTETAVLEALRSSVNPSPLITAPRSVPGLEEYPADPSIKSQKDLIKILGTFEEFMTLDELMAMRGGR